MQGQIILWEGLVSYTLSLGFISCDKGLLSKFPLKNKSLGWYVQKCLKTLPRICFFCSTELPLSLPGDLASQTRHRKLTPPPHQQNRLIPKKEIFYKNTRKLNNSYL